jgi:hypothetical protein
MNCFDSFGILILMRNSTRFWNNSGAKHVPTIQICQTDMRVLAIRNTAAATIKIVVVLLLGVRRPFQRNQAVAVAAKLRNCRLE